MGGLRIAPSILSADFSRLGEQVRAVLDAGADAIHVDVMDGHFVPPITIGPVVLGAVRRVVDGRVPLDVHLMVTEPDSHIEAFARAGADWISVHVEAAPHLHRTVHAIRELGAEPGVVLNPATPLAAVEEVLGDVHHVLVMTVNPGFGGQEMIRSCLAKVARARELLDARGLEGVEVEVDGGVKPENVAEVAAAGAGLVVAGSAVFSGGDPAGNLRSLRAAAQRGGGAQ